MNIYRVSESSLGYDEHIAYWDSLEKAEADLNERIKRLQQSEQLVTQDDCDSGQCYLTSPIVPDHKNPFYQDTFPEMIRKFSVGYWEPDALDVQEKRLRVHHYSIEEIEVF